MSRSRINWAVKVVAPWWVGLASLVAITREAGQTAPVGGSFLPIAMHAAAMPVDLVPLDTLALASDFGETLPSLSVRYAPGAPLDAKTAEEIEPRADLKNGAGAFPAVDRARKGDPAIGLRPTFDTGLRQPGGLKTVRESLFIAPHDDAVPAASFSVHDSGDPMDGAASFSPWAAGENPEDSATRGQRPSGATIAMKPAALKERLSQGATPKVARAEALASTTPAPADGAPIEATFGPKPVIANASIVPRDAGRPNYAALLMGENGARERKCLAEAVYFESRSEPEDGQAAVAQVVLNRATSGLYPPSICGVVYQNRAHYKACQFSFACEGKSLRVVEQDSWHTAERIADEVVNGKTYLSDVGGATHYHAKYVRPGWARRLVKMDVIGQHVFYKLKPGQS